MSDTPHGWDMLAEDDLIECYEEALEQRTEPEPGLVAEIERRLPGWLPKPVL